MDVTPAVLIDGAVPRNGKERCETLLDYFNTLDDSPGHKKVSKSFEFDMENGTADGPGTGGEWSEVEDEIIDCINAKLPHEFVCTVGEQEPGDVIVREIGHPSEEMTIQVASGPTKGYEWRMRRIEQALTAKSELGTQTTGYIYWSSRMLSQAAMYPSGDVLTRLEKALDNLGIKRERWER